MCNDVRKRSRFPSPSLKLQLSQNKLELNLVLNPLSSIKPKEWSTIQMQKQTSNQRPIFSSHCVTYTWNPVLLLSGSLFLSIQIFQKHPIQLFRFSSAVVPNSSDFISLSRDRVKSVSGTSQNGTGAQQIWSALASSQTSHDVFLIYFLHFSAICPVWTALTLSME